MKNELFPLMLGLNLRFPPSDLRGWTVLILVAIVTSIIGVSAVIMTRQNQPTTDPGQFAEAGWEVKYEVSRLEGIRVYDIAYHGTQVLADLRLPYIHVQYDQREYPPGSLYDRLGTENGTYRGDLEKVGIPEGVELRASFEFYQFPRRGSYFYIQRYRFHQDGRLEALVEIFGPGYGPSAHYDTVWAIRPFHNQVTESRLEEWRDSWRSIDREGRLVYQDYNVPTGTRQAVWRYGQGNWSIAMEPAPQDRAELYVGRWDPARAPGEDSTKPPAEMIGDAPLQSSPLIFYYMSHQYASQDGCGPESPCMTGPALIVESQP